MAGAWPNDTIHKAKLIQRVEAEAHRSKNVKSKPCSGVALLKTNHLHSRTWVIDFNLTLSFLNRKTVNTRQWARRKSVHEWANIWIKEWSKAREPPRTASETAELMERQRAQMGWYLDEGLHIAVKQLTVKNGARSRLPHSLGFRGKSGGPGEMVGGVWLVHGNLNNNATGIKTHQTYWHVF